MIRVRSTANPRCPRARIRVLQDGNESPGRCNEKLENSRRHVSLSCASAIQLLEIPKAPKGAEMAAKSPSSEIAVLLHLLDQAFDKKAWHGPNLRGAIRRVTAAQAEWRSDPKRHSIADVVVHAAYWKYAVRRRLRGDKRGSFSLKGSNWFVLPNPLTEKDWRSFIVLLDDQHRKLRQVVQDYPAARLHQRSPGSKYVAIDLISGIAAHDIYHAGQIQLLKRLQIANED